MAQIAKLTVLAYYGSGYIHTFKNATGVKGARKNGHYALENPIVLNLMGEEMGNIVSGAKIVTVMRLLREHKEGGVDISFVERALTSGVFTIKPSVIG